MKNIIVVGAGVIAESVLFSLGQKFSTKEINLIQVSSEGFYENCSQYSTATIALRNTKKGLSPLGDLICEGFKEFREFIEKLSPEGIEETAHYFKTYDSDPKFIKRYGAETYFEKSFLVNWKKYQSWLREKNPHKVQRIEDYVLEARESKLLLQSGQELNFDGVFFCTGLIPDEKNKRRPGSYLITDYQVTESRLYEIDGMHMIFRASDQKLLIGSTTDKENFSIPPLKELKKLYGRAERYFPLEKLLNLPKFEEFKVLTGMRSLGARFPIMEQTSSRQWSLVDFHKNGYLLSVLAANKVVEELARSIK